MRKSTVLIIHRSRVVMTLITLICALLMCLTSCKEESPVKLWVETGDSFELTEVTRIPEFKDGGQEGFEKAVLREILYPPEARENMIEGRVIVQYVVDVNGTVRDIEIVQDIGAGCGQAVVAALEQVTAGQTFDPAEIDGTPVAVRLEIPVNFALE